MSFRSKPVGWRYESHKHSLAAKGMRVKYTGFSYMVKRGFITAESSRRGHLERSRQLADEGVVREKKDFDAGAMDALVLIGAEQKRREQFAIYDKDDEMVSGPYNERSDADADRRVLKIGRLSVRVVR